MLVNEPRLTSQGNLPLEHVASRALYRHWEGMRAERAAPLRQDLNLKPIAALVSNLAIMERNTTSDEFIWRLAGTGVCDLLGGEVTGSRVITGFDAFESDIVKRFFDAVIEQLQPCVLKLNLVNETGGKAPVEMIGLPLLAQTGNGIQILAGLFSFSEAGPWAVRKISAIHLLGARSIWTEHLPGDTVVQRAEAVATQRPRLQLLRGGRE